MKTFEVHYKSHDVIVAKDIDEARRLFAEKHNTVTPETFYDCDTGESFDVIGVCEVSEEAIFEGEEFFADEEGVMVLAKYVDEEDIRNQQTEEE